MNNISCLIIDDEEKLTKSLAFALGQENIDTIEAHEGYTGLDMALVERPDIILLDVRLPDASGLDILEKIRADQPDIPIIMMSAHGDTRDAVRAIKNGAVDYLTKPFEMDELILLLRETISRKQLKSEVRYLRNRISASGNLVGESVKMVELSKKIALVAQSKAKTILLTGETGVGKAVVAREIHRQTGDVEVPFVEINCASLPEELMEAELFGVEKGAFTGAVSKRAGLVEIAENGTLFLDEIGELSLKLQAKLLTLLESWTYRRVGSSREKYAKIRVVAATNRNMETSIKNGIFRSDLFFRLNIMPIEIPRLADREGDIWLLANYFSDRLSIREGSNPIILTLSIRKVFETYSWPGNVRELKNIVERLTILYPGQEITEQHLPNELKGQVRNLSPNFIDDLDMAERNLVKSALLECHGKKGLAAEKLGISRHALKRRMQRLGL